MRRGLLLALPAAAVLAAGGVLAAPAAYAASVTVTPAGPVAHGAEVTLAVEGFQAGSMILLTQCSTATNPPTTADCADPSSSAATVVVAEPDGTATGSFTAVVGEIRPGVSCGGDSCVAAAIALTQPATVVTAPLSLTGDAGATPTATPTPTPTGTSSPSPTPTESASTGGNGGGQKNNGKNNGKGNAGQLAHTGAADANITAALAVLALQVGLVLAVRARSRRARPRHAA